MSRLADPELVTLWRARLQRFEQSQLTMAEFCEVERCPRPTSTSGDASSSGL